MKNIRTGTLLDRILEACDPRDERGGAAMAVVLGVAAHLAGRSLFYHGAHITAVNEYPLLGVPGAGKSHIMALLKALFESLDIPVIVVTPQSLQATQELLHEAMQRRVEDAPDGTPRFETKTKHAVVIVDEAGAQAQAHGRGDAAAMAVAGVQVAINMTADGRVTSTRAVSRKSVPWPELEGVTVTWYRFGQIENGGALIAASRAGAPGAERRQAPFFIRKDPPRDAQGVPLTPSLKYRRAQGAMLDRCFDVAQTIAAAAGSFGERMTAALKADLEGAVRQKIEILDPEDDAIHAAIEAAAHGDPAWTAEGGDVAYMIATYLAGVRACVRGATVTDDDDWRWAAAMVEAIHTNSEAALEEQDSETEQKRALEQLQQRFARAPFWDSGEGSRSLYRMNETFNWVKDLRARKWALATWGLANLVLMPALVNKRREYCFYRRREPANVCVDVPHEGFKSAFLAALQQVLTLEGGPEWPLPPPPAPPQQ